MYKGEVAELRAENDRLWTLADPEVTFRDLEMKIRDGSFHLRTVSGTEGGTPAWRFVAALLFHLLLGEDNEMPPNYRGYEFSLKPANASDEITVVAEIVAPGGKSSHLIRRDLEAQVERLTKQRDEALAAVVPLKD